MSTEKLYYADCHLTRFTARVLSCEAGKKGFEIILDRTAFYPEGGGQACDLGTMNGIAVTDVQEQGEDVVHFCREAIAPGTEVEGVIDWNRRFDLMQQHSGEHIISGIVNREFGFHNVGFHMGKDLVTIDFDGMIPASALARIERLANEAVWQNLPIRCWYPSPEELPTVGYRSKRELPWPVRVVEVPGYDKCACCGVHVERTGEIGVIKLFSVVKFHQGVRIEMACGSRCLELLCAVFDENRKVSQAFSAKILETGDAARKMNEMLAAEKLRGTALQKRLFASIAADMAGKGDVLIFEEMLDNPGVRDLADAVADKCGGRAAVFSGSDEGGYAYCLATRNGDLRQLGKEMTTALNGRGGGKPNFQQGSVKATRKEIEAFFADK